MPASFYAVIQGHDFWKGTFLLRFSNYDIKIFSDLESEVSILTTLKLQELELDLCFPQQSKKSSLSCFSLSIPIPVKMFRCIYLLHTVGCFSLLSIQFNYSSSLLIPVYALSVQM